MTEYRESRTTEYGTRTAEAAVPIRTEARDEACETKTFTTVEDRPIEKERVERIIEHRPVEKRYVVETRFIGERELTEGRRVEHLGTTERIVSVAQPSSVCEGAPRIEVDTTRTGIRELSATELGDYNRSTGATTRV
eukprot:jgi/Botrbrau1/14244/Bobra.0381s0006.1